MVACGCNLISWEAEAGVMLSHIIQVLAKGHTYKENKVIKLKFAVYHTSDHPRSASLIKL